MNDPYKALDIERSATADQIRKAYKKLIRKYHPDVDKSAEAKFKEVQEAYDLLNDPVKKQQYDQFGTVFPGGGAPFPGGGRGGPQGAGASAADLEEMLKGFGGGQGVDLGDLFGNVFGGGGGRAARGRPRKGRDVEATLEVPFETAARGGETEVTLDRDGTPERLSVKIPAGIESGQVIRLQGQGEPAGRGGTAGDLLVRISIAPHRLFRREGQDVTIDLPLTISEAVLGTKVEVPTLSEGPVMLTIPPGTSSGARLRLRGKGIINRQTKEPGDQYAIVKVVVPKSPSARVKELMQELDEEAPYNPRAKLW